MGWHCACLSHPDTEARTNTAWASKMKCSQHPAADIARVGASSVIASRELVLTVCSGPSFCIAGMWAHRACADTSHRLTLMNDHQYSAPSMPAYISANWRRRADTKLPARQLQYGRHIAKLRCLAEQRPCQSRTAEQPRLDVDPPQPALPASIRCHISRHGVTLHDARGHVLGTGHALRLPCGTLKPLQPGTGSCWGLIETYHGV